MRDAICKWVKMVSKISDIMQVVPHYEGLLFDAYGVLVDDTALIPGAAALWRQLDELKVPRWIVTNGSSRTLLETQAAYRAKGLEVRIEQIINSASLLQPYFAEEGLVGKRTAVLGTASSASYVRDAGGRLVDPRREDFDVLVVANQTDYPFLEMIEACLSRILAALDRGEAPSLILTNPDLIYPKDRNNFGLTAGSVALLLEKALEARVGLAKAPQFVKLGKPFPRIFAEAVRRAGSRRLLMIGDQLETDIRGARDFGLDSLLLGTGLVTAAALESLRLDPEPTYILSRWG